MSLKDCVPRIDWFGLTTGFVVFATGVLLTMTFAGAVIGIPLLLLGLGPLSKPTTLRGTPCA